MAASGSKPHAPSCSRPLKKPISLNSITESQAPNSKPSTSKSLTIVPSQEEIPASHAAHITQEELLRRRANHLKQLKKCYKDYYWALMEELKIRHRDFYWKYGISPFKEEQKSDRDAIGVAEGTDENNNNINGGSRMPGTDLIDLENSLRCAYKYNGSGCKLKAMALTSFCHLHILSDPKQKLYKACGYVIKSAHTGPITCGKAILRSTVPSLCTLHFQSAQKSVRRALKNAGLNISSSRKLAPKFHVIVAEYVRQIQAKRRAARRENGNRVAIKEETAD